MSFPVGPPNDPGLAAFGLLGTSVKQFGARGNGVADDTAAIAAAIASLPASGGDLIFPAGDYLHSTVFDIRGKRAIRFIGEGNRTAGATAATRLIYTGTDAMLRCGSTQGFEIQDMQLLYRGNMTGNYLIDCRPNAADTSYLAFRRCFIGGEGVSSANTLVALNKCIICDFEEVVFGGASCHVRGREANNAYSNVITFKDCAHTLATGTPVLDPGESWTFINPTFEPLANGNAGGIALQSTSAPWAGGSPLKSLLFLGGWFGDANANGEWISVAGEGVGLLGTRFGNGAIGLRAVDVIKGLTMAGLSFDATTNFLSVNAAAHSDWNVVANAVRGGGGGVSFAAGATFARSLIQDPVNGPTYSFGMLQGIAGAVSDASFPITPPNLTQAVDITNNRIYVRIGGVWKSVALT